MQLKTTTGPIGRLTSGDCLDMFKHLQGQ
jgi:hypothetical protein